MLVLVSLLLLLCSSWKLADSFCIRSSSPSSMGLWSITKIRSSSAVTVGAHYHHPNDGYGKEDESIMNRRSMMEETLKTMSLSSLCIPAATSMMMSYMVTAAEDNDNDTLVTSKIYINFKGISGTSSSSGEEDRIVIGLYGKAAPNSVAILKALCDEQHGGYQTSCKPKDESRTLQKDQLEANKVYNSCIESVENRGTGVTYDLSTVWRVIPNDRIDVGAVQGKFISRLPPNFQEENNPLKHDTKGTVSVRRGDEGGFGFTIYPGSSDETSSLDESHIVVGRVLEGMDIVEKLNQIPVVKSAAYTGGPRAAPRAAPSRACRYGSSEYFCSEYKPLKKILITRTGILS